MARGYWILKEGYDGHLHLSHDTTSTKAKIMKQDRVVAVHRHKSQCLKAGLQYSEDILRRGLRYVEDLKFWVE